ncbi:MULTISPECIES: helix-turn-helix domain-containing protein [Paenibacillus]|uniref:helix-turn-helix domain-containing protein n=1 Tax=Paenibacillus TaxID=44249 RepID=UPI0022B92FC8|nr:helix-turn-helix domain-containing protein [Paenibacillus caseinilyticus]MCZ8519705.1 helix-turn-helix domain-containing protein [Paenibacillus caseinilyticus]
MNYMNLNTHPIVLSFRKKRTSGIVDYYHAHQGLELLYIHEGKGTAVVEQQIIELRPGLVLVFRPYQLHRIHVQPLPQQPYVRSLFVLEPPVLDDALVPFAGLRSFLQGLWKDPLAPRVFDSESPAAGEALLALHAVRLAQPAPHAGAEEQLLFLTAFLDYIRSACRPVAPAAAGHFPLSRGSAAAESMMAWIENHFAEPFELAALARSVHLSPNHASAVFRQSVGSSLTEYVTARRIRQACWLLRTTDLSVQEIGQGVGLGSFSYFCQLFKKHTGLSPHRFRKGHP